MRNKDILGNAAQMEAILHNEGPAMVLAGPGSGKTFVIVERLRYLIQEYKVEPSSILVITFTKAAAIEMQQRFMKITDSSYPEVNFGTFHSVFYQIIRLSNPNTKLQIASESTKYKLLKDIILSAKGKGLIRASASEDYLEQLKDIASEISRIKNTLDAPEDCELNSTIKDGFKYIFEEYNNSLEEFNIIDFDDMLLRCYSLLNSEPEVLKTWQNRFRYILIDEYQDINLIQYKIIRLLCESNNLFVVGDDDQSIYGFRGSDPSIMLKFEGEFEGIKPKIINLDTNYRCGKKILDNALLLIEENSVRFKKKLHADLSNGMGYLLPRRYQNKRQQTEAILYFLKSHQNDLDKIAFIFRTNQEAISLANELKKAGIPTNLQDNAKNFAMSPAVKLCMDYLSFSCIDKRREFFFRIMNKPLRYISRECVPDEYVNEFKVKNYYRGNQDKLREIDKLFKQINIIAKMRPSLSVRFLRNEVGIDKLYPGEIDALNEMSEMAMTLPDNRALIEKITALRSEDENLKKSPKAKGNCLKLLTMHGSKGLEFDIVWLPNLNEGIIPSRSSVTSLQIEEERRMLYVGMTRAKTALIMSYLTGNEENPMLPSRFLRPLRYLWEERKNQSSSPSRPSSGSSTISSNSTSSR
ncbi:MAG: ATP-dependent helicase [Butyrivibrio sp.]|nr:ATP-dependent helicase [Butyrivibrio sp.]